MLIEFLLKYRPCTNTYHCYRKCVTAGLQKTAEAMKKPRAGNQSALSMNTNSPGKRKHRRPEDEPSSEEENSMTNYEAFMLAIQQSAADEELIGDKRSRAVSSDRSSENGSDEITAIMNFEGNKIVLSNLTSMY